MEVDIYHVQADWDPEAEVWVATSEDVPGLATEADTIEALMEKLQALVPELLTMNAVVGGEVVDRTARDRR
jgi:predicted RNase H-like HicB family nuclease